MGLGGAPENYTDEDLLAAWLDSWGGTGDGTTSWAVDELHYHLVWEQPERAWPFIVELAERITTLQTLAILAAGELEDLLCHHGPDFIDRVEAQSAASPRFRRCLSGVWGHTRMDPVVYQRMRAAVDDVSL